MLFVIAILLSLLGLAVAVVLPPVGLVMVGVGMLLVLLHSKREREAKEDARYQAYLEAAKGRPR